MAGTAFSAANWDGYDEHATNLAAGSALTDFTLIVDISDLSATFDSTVQSDGADIRCTKDDGTTELAYDLIDWAYNTGSPTGLLRIKWSSTLATSGTQKVRIYAGYTSGTATAYGAADTYGSDNAYDSNTWSSAPLVADGGDRTSTSNSFTANGGLTFGGGTGLLGSATDFDSGSSQYLSASNTNDWSGAWSATLLCKFDDLSTRRSFLGLFGDNNLQVWCDDVVTPDQFAVYDGSSVAYGTAGPSTGTWYSIAYHTDGSTSSDVRVDGASDASTGSPSIGYETIAIGLAGGAKYMDGLIQHLTLSTVERSTDWLDEESSQLLNNSTYFGSWSWTATGGAGTTIARLLEGGLIRGGALMGGRLVG